MKRVLSFVMVAALAIGATAFNACSDDDKNNGGNNGNNGGNETENSELVGKWEMGENDLGIVSVEFDNRNNYVVVAANEWFTSNPANGEVLNSRAETEIEYIPRFGTYTVEGDKVILSDLGTMTVSSIADGVIEFTLEIEGEDGEISLSGDKQEEMASSSKTDMLCRRWKLVSMDPPAEEGDDDEENPEFVYFSKAGTYLVSFDNGESMLSNWKWKSEADGTIYYSDDFPAEWSEESTAKVTTLTASKLVVYEVVDDDEFTTTFEPAN